MIRIGKASNKYFIIYDDEDNPGSSYYMISQIAILLGLDVDYYLNEILIPNNAVEIDGAYFFTNLDDARAVKEKLESTILMNKLIGFEFN